MKPFELIAKKVDERGITLAELGRRVNINPELLRRSLNGDRKIEASELVSLCVVLDLSIKDFQSAMSGETYETPED